MIDLKIKRKENEEVYVLEKFGWKHHHMGIPVKTPIENEGYIPHLQYNTNLYYLDK